MTRPKPRDPDLEIYRRLNDRVRARESAGYVAADDALDVVEADDEFDCGEWDRWREPK